MADLSKYFTDPEAPASPNIGKFFDAPVAPAPVAPVAPDPGVMDYARLGFRGLVKEAPLQAAATVAGMIEGPEGVEPANPDIGDQIRGYARRSGEEFAADVRTTLGEGFVPEMVQAIPSLGYSAATMPVTAAASAAGAIGGAALGAAAGLPTGPGALTTAGAGAVGGATAGLAAGYLAMDRAAQAQILGDLAAQEERKMGRPFTEPEFAAFKADLDAKVAAYGGWEAGPEALSNVIDLAILRKVPGASAITKAGKKLLGIAATELPTETITQIGQSQALEGTSQARPDGPLSFTSPGDIATAGREVLPGVLVVGGGMTIANAALEAATARSNGETPETRERALEVLKFKTENPGVEIPDEVIAGFVSGQPLTGEAPLTQGDPIDAVPEMRSPGTETREEVQDLRVQSPEVALAGERRANLTRRERLAQLTPEELEQEVYRAPRTGLPNKRAFEENPRLPVVASLDLDGLKWVNDNMNHQSGDELIRAIGTAIAEITPEGYDVGGDEFIIQGETPEAVQQVIDKIKDQLSGAVIEYTAPNGDITRKTGVEFGYGIGTDIASAEEGLKLAKAKTRGAEPAGVVRIPAARGDAASAPAQEEVAPAEPATPEARMRAERRAKAEAPVEGTAPVEAAPAPLPSGSLPRLKRGYKRSTFTVAKPDLAGNVFVEDVSPKGVKTLSVRRPDGSIQPATKFIADMVSTQERQTYDGPAFSETSDTPDPITALTDAIAKETGKPIAAGTFTQVAPPKGQEALFAALASVLKKEIVFFKGKDAPMTFNGVTGISEGIIYVNIDATKPHLVIAGHEFLHDLKKDDPESYAALRDVIMEVIPEKTRMKMWQGLNLKRQKEGRQPLALTAVDEELIADFFGEQFTSKEFWAKVERRNPEGFAGLVQKLLAFLDRIKAALTGEAREDIQRAQDAAAAALARYVEKNPEAGYELSLSGERKFSEPLSPKALAKLLSDLGLPSDLPLPNDFAVNDSFFEVDSLEKQRDEVLAASLAFVTHKTNPKAVKEAKDAADQYAKQQAAIAAVNTLRALEPSRGDVTGEQGPSEGVGSRDENYPRRLDSIGLGLRATAEALSGAETPDAFKERLKAEIAAGRAPEVQALIAGLQSLGYIVTPETFQAAIEAQVRFESITDSVKFSESVLTDAPKKNLKALKDSLLSGAVATQNLGKLLKITPEPVVAEVWGDDMPQVKTLYAARRQRDAVRNDLINEFGLQYKTLVQDKATRAAVNKAAETASFHQMWPDRTAEEQDWFPKNDSPLGERYVQAQAAWVAAGMQSATGKTFREAYKDAAQAYQALKPEVQQNYLMAVELMQQLRLREKDGVQRIIEEYTQDNPALREEQLAALNQSFASLKGAYWPFYREGEFVLSYMDAGQRHVEHFTSVFEREMAAQALVQGGVDAATIRLDTKDKMPKALALVPSGYNAQLGQAVEAAYIEDRLKGVDPADQVAVEEATAQAKQDAAETVRTMTEIWLKWQPETSALKNHIRRKNVLGWSSDMLRGFLEYGQTHAAKVAQLEQGRKIETLLNDIGADLKARTGDITRQRIVLIDLRDREAASKTATTSVVAQKLGKLTTFYYMTSPSIALVQMTQLGVLTLPKLATMPGIGMAKATNALRKGVQAAFSPKYTRKAMFGDEQVNSVFQDMQAVVTTETRTDFPGKYDDVPLGTPLFSKAELTTSIAALSSYQKKLLALHVAMSRGLLDISLSHEVGDIVRGEDPESTSNKVFTGMMVFMRESEKASRKAAILAAFDASGGEMDFFKGMQAVEEVVESTLYNYSKDAKGVLLQGGVARVLTTFQTFRIMTAFKLGLLFKQSFAKESPEVRTAARKELVGIFAMSGLVAGALGMPFAPILFKVLDAVLGDDDEPFDSEAEFRQWVAENFGETAAGVAMDGPTSLLGASLSRRIGLGDVVGSQSELPARLHGEGALGWYATQALGPSYSVMSGWARGYDQMVNEGETMKGLIAATPKPLADMLKAYGYATDGLKTGLGKRLMTAEEVDANEVLLQGLGFAPFEISRMRGDQAALDQLSTRISQRRGQLMQDFVRAYMEDGETEEQMEAIREYNAKAPALAIGGGELRGALRIYLKRDAGLDTRREMLLKR